MSANQLETLLIAARRRAVVAVLRAHPEWTLADLAEDRKPQLVSRSEAA